MDATTAGNCEESPSDGSKNLPTRGDSSECAYDARGGRGEEGGRYFLEILARNVMFCVKSLSSDYNYVSGSGFSVLARSRDSAL